MIRSRLSALAVLIGTCVLAGVSQGAFVTMKLESASPTLDISLTRDSGMSWQTMTVGQFNWKGIVTNPIGLQDVFYGFCIELGQDVTVGLNYANVYEPVSLDGAPLPAVAPNQPMGIAAAHLINSLWSGHRAGLSTPEDFAAFQVCIWEIVYDPGLSLTADAFQIRDNPAVLALAQGWLNGLNPNAPLDPKLYALTALQFQDMLVPAPGALSLLAGGLIILARRRR